jgi:hypothetical protein
VGDGKLVARIRAALPVRPWVERRRVAPGPERAGQRGDVTRQTEGPHPGSVTEQYEGDMRVDRPNTQPEVLNLWELTLT